MNSLFPTSADFLRVLPVIILAIFGTSLMVLEPLTGEGKGEKPQLRWLAIVGLALAMIGAVVSYSDPGAAFNGMLMVDGFGTFFSVLVIGTGLLTVFCAQDYLVRERHENGEFYALLLFSIAGQCIMATANELIILFIGLEISSIASYVLAGFLRDDRRANESAIKYFLLGSFATAFMLYGVAWIYGLTGSTNLAVIQSSLAANPANPRLLAVAVALMFVGFAFKVSAVPFQIWAPDVYQGAPAPVSAFLSAGPKAAAFAIFLRVFTTAFGASFDKWEPVFWASALLTMIVGNFAALRQSNIKRLLAYSSIAHAGYVMVAVTSHSTVGTAAAMFYLASYAFVNVGAFAVVSYVAAKGEKHLNIDDFGGLAARQPLAALVMTIFFTSLIGVPLTAGFFGKFYIFKAALDAGMVWLTVLGLLNSAVAAYYYLRVIVVMYTHEPSAAVNDLEPASSSLQFGWVAAATATLALGLLPSALLEFASRAALLR